jgi:spore germination protein Q
MHWHSEYSPDPGPQNHARNKSRNESEKESTHPPKNKTKKSSGRREMPMPGYLPETMFPYPHLQSPLHTPFSPPLMMPPPYPAMMANPQPKSPPIALEEHGYVETFLRENMGKKITAYMNYEGSDEWRDRIFSGIIRKVGRDCFIIYDEEIGKNILLLDINVNFILLDEPEDQKD